MHKRNYISWLYQTVAVCLTVAVVGISSFAQYRGAPVKKDRLIKALRSKLLPSQEIVAVISTNGVDFRLTPEIRQALISAGARPEVIRAVEKNLRNAAETLYAGKTTENGSRPVKFNENEYNSLVDKAMYSFEEQKNPANAVRYLQSAIQLNPDGAKAYQMMGFVNLYGLNDLENTRRYMKKSMSRGGSAVFRVYHDDSGNFSGRCAGSLYLSADKIRFESDDNVHTFETSMVNVVKIENDTENSDNWKKHPILVVQLKFGKEKAKFRFAPITGKFEESNMAAYFISELQTTGFEDKTVDFGSAVLKIRSDF